MARRSTSSSADYGALLERLKAEIAGAHARAALKVNEEQITLHWRIGCQIFRPPRPRRLGCEGG
jgi:hypothetical protein